MASAQCSRIASINHLMAIILHQIVNIYLVRDYLIPAGWLFEVTTQSAPLLCICSDSLEFRGVPLNLRLLQRPEE